MCFGLRNNLDIKDGQIAHLDRDRTNIDIENLAYLCLECHKAYDSKSNRVLSYTAGEIARYRLKLYRARGEDHVEWTITVRAHRSQYTSVKESVAQVHTILRDTGVEVGLNETTVN